MTGLSTALAVAVAGGAGAAARFVADRMLSPAFRPGYGFVIVLVNVTGSFALGLALAVWGPGSAIVTVVGTGFLGGYTTFSTAALDGAQMALRGRGVRALAHAGGTALVCILAAWLGLHLGA